MAKVTGIGGVFFKAKSDPAELGAWYKTHLGLQLEPWGGAILRWPDDQAEDRGLTVWSVAKPDTQWFAPSEASFMINYRVDELDVLLGNLRAANVTIVKGPETHENGKFAWILDPDGNKLELWEPALYREKPAEDA
jgi:predicted enzyme related to lactoylglutathione lyase